MPLRHTTPHPHSKPCSIRSGYVRRRRRARRRTTAAAPVPGRGPGGAARQARAHRSRLGPARPGALPALRQPVRPRPCAGRLDPVPRAGLRYRHRANRASRRRMPGLRLRGVHPARRWGLPCSRASPGAAYAGRPGPARPPRPAALTARCRVAKTSGAPHAGRVGDAGQAHIHPESPATCLWACAERARPGGLNPGAWPGYQKGDFR